MQSPPGACRSLAHRCGAATHEPAQQPVNPDLLNIFEVFLPQLLLYPNPADPLNGEAAAMLIREPEAYARRVRGALPGAPGTRHGMRWAGASAAAAKVVAQLRQLPSAAGRRLRAAFRAERGRGGSCWLLWSCGGGRSYRRGPRGGRRQRRGRVRVERR